MHVTISAPALRVTLDPLLPKANGDHHGYIRHSRLNCIQSNKGTMDPTIGSANDATGLPRLADTERLEGCH